MRNQLRVVRVDPNALTEATVRLPLEFLGTVEIIQPPVTSYAVVTPIRRRPKPAAEKREKAARMQICLQVLRANGWLNADELRSAFAKELHKSVSSSSVSSYIQSFKRDNLILVQKRLVNTNGIRVWKEYYRVK